MEAHDLTLVSGWYSGGLLERSVADEMALVEDHLTLLSGLGCDVMVFAEVTGCVHGMRGTPLSKRRVLDNSEWVGFAERLSETAKHLADRGVAMAYHHHMGTVIQTEAEIDRLMALTSDAVGLLLDTGHLSYAGGDPISVAGRHGARINHVHCKDVRLDVLKRVQDADTSFLDAVLDGVFSVPGDGGIDFPGVLAALSDNGYKGWLVVEAEQDPAVAHPLSYARMGYTALCAALKV